MWLENIVSSNLKVIIGWILAMALGLLLAIVRFYLPEKIQKNSVFNFVIDLIKFPPPIAWIPFVVIYSGISFWSSIIVIIVGGFPPFFTTIYDLLLQTKKQYVYLSNTFGMSRLRNIFNIYLPSHWPQIYTAARVSLGMSWMSVVASEMISSQSGLGYLIQLHRINIEYGFLFLDILLIAISGYVMNYVLLYIEKKHFKWNIE